MNYKIETIEGIGKVMFMSSLVLKQAVNSYGKSVGLQDVAPFD